MVVDFHLDSELQAVRKLMVKYASVPMPLADACLVRMAELDKGRSIVTLDSDFHVYRRHGRKTIALLRPD